MAHKHHARKLPGLRLRQALAFRMKRQHLLVKADDVVSSVRSSCGIQSQIPQQARIALWARTRDLTADKIDESLWRTRSLVKTWCMGATVHLLPSSDFYVYIQAAGPDAIRSEKRWMSRYGLSGQVVDEAAGAIFDALAGGPPTRAELGEKVARLAGDGLRQWVERGWGGLVKIAALRGLVCFGPDRGREVTFVRVKDWLPDANEPQAGWVSPVLLLNGRAAGVWEAERKGSSLAVSVKTFGPIRREVLAAVEMQAESLAQFFGCKSQLTVKSDLGY